MIPYRGVQGGIRMWDHRMRCARRVIPRLHRFGLIPSGIALGCVRALIRMRDQRIGDDHNERTLAGGHPLDIAVRFERAQDARDVTGGA